MCFVRVKVKAPKRKLYAKYKNEMRKETVMENQVLSKSIKEFGLRSEGIFQLNLNTFSFIFVFHGFYN